MISHLKHLIGIFRRDDLPSVYPRRYSDWLERPLSKQNIKHPSDFWLGRRMDNAFKQLSYSPSFSILLEDCPAIEDIPVFLERLKGKAGEYNVIDREVTVNVSDRRLMQVFADPKAFAMTMAHEYRHAYQYLMGLRGARDLNALNDDPLLEELLGEADAVAFEARVCWELGKEKSFSTEWMMFSAMYPKVAKAFKKEMRSSRDMEEATTHALKAWFLDNRKVKYYSKKYLRELKAHIDESPFSKAWEGYWRKAVKEWQEAQPTLITSGEPENAVKRNFSRASRGSPREPIEEQEPSLQFAAGDLRELSASYFLQNVPDDVYGEILKTRRELSDYSSDVSVHSARLRDRKFQPFS